MVARENYRTIPHRLRHLEEFTGNSMAGRWRDGQYVVQSYGTEIARHDPETGETSLHPDRFSATTSRHQNLAAGHLPGDHVGYARPPARGNLGPPGRLRAPSEPLEMTAVLGPRVSRSRRYEPLARQGLLEASRRSSRGELPEPVYTHNPLSGHGEAGLQHGDQYSFTPHASHEEGEREIAAWQQILHPDHAGPTGVFNDRRRG